MALIKDYKQNNNKRLEFLKENGKEPIYLNGYTLSAEMIDNIEYLAGYSSMKPFNIYDLTTWTARDTQDINEGFERWVNNSFNGSNSELESIIELRIRRVDKVVNDLSCTPSQAQYWLGHKKWLESYSIAKDKKDNPKFSLRQVAIIRHYLNEPIITENQNEVAKQYKHNSGQRLFSHFQNVKKLLKYPDEFSDRKLGRWLSDFEKAKIALTDEAKDSIENDIKMLELVRNDILDKL